MQLLANKSLHVRSTVSDGKSSRLCSGSHLAQYSHFSECKGLPSPPRMQRHHLCCFNSSLSPSLFACSHRGGTPGSITSSLNLCCCLAMSSHMCVSKGHVQESSPQPGIWKARGLQRVHTSRSRPISPVQAEVDERRGLLVQTIPRIVLWILSQGTLIYTKSNTILHVSPYFSSCHSSISFTKDSLHH